MSLKITIEGLDLSSFSNIKYTDITNLINQSLREHAGIVNTAWSNKITAQPGLRPTKDGKGRRPYKHALRFKTWKWTVGVGVTAVFGPSGREIPHAHLAEEGTKMRSRHAYYRPAKDEKGHGIRGRFEFVNYRGSRKHGRPPFPEGHPILTTGAAIARKWRESTMTVVAEQYANAVTNTFIKKFNDYLQEKLR